MAGQGVLVRTALLSLSHGDMLPDARYRCCHVIVQNITPEGLTQRPGE
jgi:hypothetical protein